MPKKLRNWHLVYYMPSSRYEGSIYCKERDLFVEASGTVHHFFRDNEGLFCKECENYVVNQSSHYYLNKDEDDVYESQ